MKEFYELWIKLKVLESSDLPKSKLSSFHYYQAFLSFLTLISSYLFFHIVLSTRKYIKSLYKLLFIFYSVFILIILVFFIFNKKFIVFVNPNHLASFLSIPIPLILYKFYIKKNYIKSDIFFTLLKTIYLMVIFFLLYATNARSVFISLLIVLGIYFFIERKKLKFSIVIVFYSLIIIAGLSVFFSKEISESNIIVWEQIKNSSSLEAREYFIENSINIFKENPFFGVGIGQYSLAYPFYTIGNDDIFVHHAHNDYVQFLVEYGIFGVSIILYFYFCLILFIKKSLSRLKGNSLHLFIATIFSILMFHFQIFTSFQSHIGLFVYMMMFLIASLYLIVYNFDRYYKTNNEELL